MEKLEKGQRVLVVGTRYGGDLAKQGNTGVVRLVYEGYYGIKVGDLNRSPYILRYRPDELLPLEEDL